MPPQKQPATTSGKIRRVLVVDNSVGMRLYLRTILTAVGFVCAEASDGAEAFERVVQGEADLVITDLEMPRMNGFELLSAVSLLPADRRPPVIVISALIDENLVERRPELRMAAALLDKPINARTLLKSVAGILEVSVRPG